VYGAVTALLVAVYAGLVVGLGSLVGSRSNSLVLAGSTLVVAALIRPARRRIQVFIDRSFYRSRYDASRTLENFGAVLRTEIKLLDMERSLLDVVHLTLQPARASIWLTGRGHLTPAAPDVLTSRPGSTPDDTKRDPASSKDGRGRSSWRAASG
jgi:hypothetical protein